MSTTMTGAELMEYFMAPMVFDHWHLVANGKKLKLFNHDDLDLEVESIEYLLVSDPLPEGAIYLGRQIRPGHDLGLFQVGNRLLLRTTAAWNRDEIYWVDPVHSQREVG